MMLIQFKLVWIKSNTIYNFTNLTLLGDKGYISQTNYKFNNKLINLITYKKKNQVPNTKINLEILKERIYSENAFAKIKKNERILTRKDHNIKNYMSFVFIGSLINNLKVINTKKIVKKL